MKKSLLALSLVLGCTSVNAEENVKFVNADGSPLGELCIAAVNDEAGLLQVAGAHGIPAIELDQVYCNGKPLRSWVHQYRDTETKVTAYVVSAANDAPESQLCLAALTSDDQYANIVAAHFAGISKLEEQIICNGVSLRQFVLKYRDRLANPETAAL